MLDTDQLRSFLAIVDTGSFTRAADRVGKTQSAVSMHVRRLEERLECDLFIKQGRGTRLSADGERLVEHARRMLQVEAAALYDLKAQGLSGRVVLGIPDDYAEPFLPDIVGQFSRLHPLVELSIVCHPSVRLAECVATGEVDLAVVTGCDRIKGVEILREEPLCWVAGVRAGAVEEERPLPLALSTPSCTWRNEALTALQRAGIASRVFLMSSNYAALAPIVQAGLALTVLPGTVASATGHRIVAAAAGLPALPNVRVGLILGAPSHPKEARAMAEVIRATIGGAPVSQRAVTRQNDDTPAYLVA
ncbi:LysR family transcriptional regulator [Lichenihabitans sp. Uapishka_5]|uniref:LysR family transcriptional regulator n=1 Tax=Lichenihabitans sp. Uapishka_5 TaxID=3037302 RepID=UPI0029E80BA2|nr:LysR family transcriptional regulator [Lichenihabitans sp. Uapishka_5]MDX7951371.1 LysR family transcriptional regulator [Lichenihabitans sp. Uapishka_5]